MRLLYIAAIALGCVACSRTGESVAAGDGGESDLGGASAGGAGGAGGEGMGTTTSTSSTATAGGEGGATCMPADVFVGWDGCYRPDPLCCGDLYCVNVAARCALETDGLTEPYLCATVPPVTGGGLTDFRSCLQLAGEIGLDCTWGASAILCCEP